MDIVRQFAVRINWYNDTGNGIAIAAINGWNRINIAARTPARTYHPAKAHAAKL